MKRIMELMRGWHMGYHLCSSLGYTNGFKVGYRRGFVYIVSRTALTPLYASTPQIMAQFYRTANR